MTIQLVETAWALGREADWHGELVSAGAALLHRRGPRRRARATTWPRGGWPTSSAGAGTTALTGFDAVLAPSTLGVPPLGSDTRRFAAVPPVHPARRARARAAGSVEPRRAADRAAAARRTARRPRRARRGALAARARRRPRAGSLRALVRRPAPLPIEPRSERRSRTGARRRSGRCEYSRAMTEYANPEHDADVARRHREERRAVEEAGGGESEGFELAEQELIEHTSHGDDHTPVAHPARRRARRGADRRRLRRGRRGDPHRLTIVAFSQLSAAPRCDGSIWWPRSPSW